MPAFGKTSYMCGTIGGLRILLAESADLALSDGRVSISADSHTTRCIFRRRGYGPFSGNTSDECGAVGKLQTVLAVSVDLELPDGRNLSYLRIPNLPSVFPEDDTNLLSEHIG